MGTIKNYKNRVVEARNNLLSESERIIEKHENDIVRLQTSQLDEGMGEDGNILENANPIFSGHYTMATQMINPNKIAGDLYNFFETGAFLSGLQLQMSNDKLSFQLFSTGTGSGDKKSFFDGYNNLFGLDNKNSQIVNYDILYPELLTYLNSKI